MIDIAASLAASVCSITINGRVMLTMHYDGTIEISEGYTPTEAGDAFLDYLRPAFHRMVEQERGFGCWVEEKDA